MSEIYPDSKVDRELLAAVLKYVRRDGPLSAPFCFLTIEDGGGLKDNDLKSRDAFLKAFQGSGVNEPKPGETMAEVSKVGSIKEEIGQLGIKVAKIMASLCNVQKYGNYVYETLYQRNEMNVKYYPISYSRYHGGSHNERKSVEQYIGLTIHGYREACHLTRTNTFLEHSEIFTKDRFYIVACERWYPVLINIFKDISYCDTYTHVENGKEIFKLYFDTSGVAIFAYFGLLGMSISDKQIYDFVQIIKKYVSKSILKRLGNSAL